jgi:hypothetical protein
MPTGNKFHRLLATVMWEREILGKVADNHAITLWVMLLVKE